jgi:hypothetical protein
MAGEALISTNTAGPTEGIPSHWLGSPEIVPGMADHLEIHIWIQPAPPCAVVNAHGNDIVTGVEIFLMSNNGCACQSWDPLMN